MDQLLHVVQRRRSSLRMFLISPIIWRVTVVHVGQGVTVPSTDEKAKYHQWNVSERSIPRGQDPQDGVGAGGYSLPSGGAEVRLGIPLPAAQPLSDYDQDFRPGISAAVHAYWRMKKIRCIHLAMSATFFQCTTAERHMQGSKQDSMRPGFCTSYFLPRSPAYALTRGAA